MRLAKAIRLSLLSIVLLFLLISINKDLYSYFYQVDINRSLNSGVDGKGNYLLTSEIPLKKAVYKLQINGTSVGTQNGWYIESDGVVMNSGRFQSTVISQSIDLPVESASTQIQFGVSFDPETSPKLEISRMSIKSDHVLYRDSLFRHIISSLLLIIVFGLLILHFEFTGLWKRKIGQILTTEHEKTLLLVGLLTLLTSYPLLISDSYVLGDDFHFHLSRIEGIAESIKAGYFPARIHLFILQDYGYGAGFYYPQLFLLLPVLLRLLGFSVITAYKFFVITCSFLSILSVYYATKQMSRSRFASSVSACLYAFAAYRLINIYYRGALGEIQSAIFIPLVILGLYRLFCEDSRKWYIFAFGFWGLCASHLISTLIAAFAVTLFLLANARRILNDKKMIISLCKAAFAVFMLNAYFLLPMLEQYQTNATSANILLSTAPGDVFYARVLNPSSLFSYFNSWEQERVFIGYPILLTPFLRFFVGRRKNLPIKIVDTLLISATVCLIVSTKVFPWEVLVWFFNRIQFSWRLLMLATPVLSIACGILVSIVFTQKDRYSLCFLIFGFCSVCSIPFFQEVVENRIVKTEYFILENNRIGGGEFLPRNASFEFLDKNGNRVISQSEDVDILGFDRRGLSFSFDYSAANSGDNDLLFEAPLVYYTGYKAKVTDESGGRSAPIVKLGEHGLTSVEVYNFPKANVQIYYEQTTLQWLGNLISLLSLFLVLIFIVNKRRPLAVFSQRISI